MLILRCLALGSLFASTTAVSAQSSSKGANPYLDLLPPPPSGPSTPIDLPPPITPVETLPAAPADPVAVDEVTPVSPSVEPAPATPVAAALPETPVVPEEAPEPEPAVRWYQPSYWFGPSPWDSGIEFGLNGSSGTSESLSFRTGGFIKRKADDYKFDGSIYYNKTQSEGIEVQSNALLDLRYDWLFDDSPWTLFVISQTFFDEFQAFDLNFNVNSGFGYQWIDSDSMQLTTSVGAGASREFGGPIVDEWVAEANFGINFERKLSENRKFYAKADYFPEWADFGNYRVLADVGMEFELHQPTNTSLKISATDRYDSQPQGAESNNLNYSVLLIWKK